MDVNKKSKTILVLDDETFMVDNLCNAFQRFSEGELGIQDNILRDKILQSRYFFDKPKMAGDKDQINQYLRERPSWDVIIIDRLFANKKELNCDILASLHDLQIRSVKIVWTANSDHRNIIECMRMDAWDYIDKKNPYYEDTMTDVIVSAIKGLQALENNMRKAEINRAGHQFVVEHYREIYSAHKGHFIAVAKDDDGNWSINPIVYDISLFGLYLKLKNTQYTDHENIHITLIHE